MKKYYTRHEPIQLKNATKIHHETQSTQLHPFKEKSKWTPLTTCRQPKTRKPYRSNKTSTSKHTTQQESETKHDSSRKKCYQNLRK